jgi:hypothetical protein
MGKTPPMWKDFLDAIGFVPGQAVAGFAGGLVNVFLLKNLQPFDVMGALVIGTFAAVYLGKFLSDTTHLPLEVICFFLGAGGAPVLGQLISYLRTKLPGGSNASS